MSQCTAESSSGQVRRIMPMWPWHRYAWAPGPQDALPLKVFISADLCVDCVMVVVPLTLQRGTLYPEIHGRAVRSETARQWRWCHPGDVWICVRVVDLWVCFFARDTTVSKDTFHNTQRSEGGKKRLRRRSGMHCCVCERDTLIFTHKQGGGIKSSPLFSRRYWKRRLRGKWQATGRSNLPPPSTIVQASVPCGVCCLGNSMTLDPPVEVLGWGEVGLAITCFPQV